MSRVTSYKNKPVSYVNLSITMPVNKSTHYSYEKTRLADGRFEMIRTRYARDSKTTFKTTEKRFNFTDGQVNVFMNQELANSINRYGHHQLPAVTMIGIPESNGVQQHHVHLALAVPMANNDELYLCADKVRPTEANVTEFVQLPSWNNSCVGKLTLYPHGHEYYASLSSDGRFLALPLATWTSFAKLRSRLTQPLEIIVAIEFSDKQLVTRLTPVGVKSFEHMHNEDAQLLTVHELRELPGFAYARQTHCQPETMEEVMALSVAGVGFHKQTGQIQIIDATRTLYLSINGFDSSKNKWKLGFVDGTDYYMACPYKHEDLFTAGFCIAVDVMAVQGQITKVLGYRFHSSDNDRCRTEQLAQL